ncbi:DUF692 domain-containing protein [Polycladidibacter stylochi]|uniref:MNIO family bufferin maturase n=1 Tax=Polycladidibacter stylochi TaxID=1807766 RepID=UPI000832305A|nr:DUF692 domain-containing protein [Pseudovibrio stylochi]
MANCIKNWEKEQARAFVGVGLKSEHYNEILRDKPSLDFFEVHAENYMGAGGSPHAYLEAITESYPLSLHGVGLSIGGAGKLDRAHLQRLKMVHDRYQPVLFSEHLAWSTHEGTFFNDLLPLPYTSETLRRVCEHIDEVQQTLGRQMLLENPSTYIVFEQSTISETEFLSQVAQATGCGLLLDVNNVFVSCTNIGCTPEGYLHAFPHEHVGEMHLGGHAEDQDEFGSDFLIDAHDREVSDPVWSLYKLAISLTKGAPTLIEWDNDVPEFTRLYSEAEAARSYLQAFHRQRGNRHVA